MSSSEGPPAGTSNVLLDPETEEMSVYKKEARKVVTFQIIYDEEDFDTDEVVTFKPEMAHQVFGDSEVIFGYRKLSITISYLHNSCRSYLNLENSGKIASNSVAKADNIIESLNPWLSSNYTQSYDEFLQWIRNERHDKMYGEVIESFTDTVKMKKFPDQEITVTYKITQNDTSSEEFREFHARFESYIVWFIDAANTIDLEDSRWIIFYVYEEFEHPISKKLYRSPIAFCTVYKFFAYPLNVRMRVSQFFVLPKHQKRGIGTAFYQTVLKTLRNLKEVIDITVEEPTAAFQKIRDLEDCGVMHQMFKQKGLNFFTVSSKVAFQLGKDMKIGRRQMQRVYDILGLYYSKQKGTIQYKRMLENIRTRINGNSERESRAGKRFCKFLQGPGVAEATKKEHNEYEYKKYTDDLKPSVEYVCAKLDKWLEKNGLLPQTT